MRTLRVSLAGMVMLTLAGGLSVTVAAHDEPDPMAPGYFTFTLDSTTDPEGIGTAVHAVVEDGFATVLAVMAGEGDYEGLTLVITQDFDDDAQTLRGVIIPSDKVPPFPDSAEPVAEERRGTTPAAYSAAVRNSKVSAMESQRSSGRSDPRHSTVSWTVPSVKT